MADAANHLAAAFRQVIAEAVLSALAQPRLAPQLSSPTKQVEDEPDWPPDRMLYPLTEVRQKLGGISPTTFYQFVADEQIAVVKIGRRSFVTAAALNAYVERLGGG